MDIFKFFKKLKFICHWAYPVKDFKWSNVPGVKLSLFSESDDTFTSLQAFSNFRYLFSGFMNYLWSFKELKDLTSLSLDELFGNLKVHEMIINKDSKIVKAMGEIKSLALKAKKESCDEESLTSKSEDEVCAMAVRNFKRFFKRRGRFMRQPMNGKSERKCFRCRDPNHLIGECLKPSKDKNQRTFIKGSWCDSSEEDDEKAKDETCLMA
nr:serine/threonine protein kinase SRPK1 [Tanacetum cinerariifolium]